MITAFACLAISMFCRCTTTKYVPMVQYKERIVNKTDSFLKTDSVWLHDSVFVSQRGDTIFTDRWHYKEKYKYINKTHIDTLTVRDSIPYKVEISKPLSRMQTIFMSVGKLFVTIIVLLTVMILIALILKKYK